MNADTKADHTELLARLDCEDAKYPIRNFSQEGKCAAVIRSLQAQTDLERTAREEAEQHVTACQQQLAAEIQDRVAIESRLREAERKARTDDITTETMLIRRELDTAGSRLREVEAALRYLQYSTESNGQWADQAVNTFVRALAPDRTAAAHVPTDAEAIEAEQLSEAAAAPVDPLFGWPVIDPATSPLHYPTEAMISTLINMWSPGFCDRRMAVECIFAVLKAAPSLESIGLIRGPHVG